MSLFRTIPTSGDFSPLFRLLDDYDVHRSSRGQTSTIRSFAPRFDVRETSDAYHLDGELPGVSQKDIDIEFSDPQTLVIKGRVEREYRTPDSTGSEAEGKKPEGESKKPEGESKKSEGESKESHKYWVSERSIGEFSRTFTFPTRVDQDNVKASLKNGILSLVIPKATAPGTKKITIG